MAKFVYFFGNGKAEGKSEMKNLLGGKGANLAEMTNIGLPVPAGFTISTEVCTYYYANKKTYPKSLQADVKKLITKIEKINGGEIRRPEESASCLGPFGRTFVDAGNDGHDPQPRLKR